MLSTVIEVESLEEAKEMYRNQEIVLYPDDFFSVEFEEEI